MALYAPTDYIRYIDRAAMRSDRSVLEAGLDSILSDQARFLNQTNIVIADQFWRYRTKSESFVEVARYHLDATDLCDAASLLGARTAALECVLCKCDASTEGEFRIATTVGADSTTTAFTNTDWEWVPSLGTIYGCDATEETVVVSIERTSGSGYIWVAGVFALV